MHQLKQYLEMCQRAIKTWELKAAGLDSKAIGPHLATDLEPITEKAVKKYLSRPIDYWIALEEQASQAIGQLNIVKALVDMPVDSTWSDDAIYRVLNNI